MINNNRVKTVELYLESQKYSNKEVIEHIERAVEEFPKKDVKVDIQINEWGVFVIRLDYIDQKRRRGREQWKKK